jgi:hypothetical protein
MNELSSEQFELLNEFNKLIKVSQNKAIFARGIEIQKEEMINLNNYLKLLQSKKLKYISEEREQDANFVLYLEMSVKTIHKELSMLINLKEDRMAEAWYDLIEAQILIGSVIRNHPLNGDSLNGYLQRLDIYEKLLFPQMMFSSVGGIVKKSECSICGTDYDDCDHIKGKFYMGEMCCRIISEMELEEVSMVENPANKVCRALTFQDSNGDVIDLMTLRKKDDSKPSTLIM